MCPRHEGHGSLQGHRPGHVQNGLCGARAGLRSKGGWGGVHPPLKSWLRWPTMVTLVWRWGGGVTPPPPAVHGHSNTSLPPCVTFTRVVVSLRGRGQSPVLPFACCVGSLLSVGRCGRCSFWCRFRISPAQWLAYWGSCWLLRGSLDGFCCPLPSAFWSSTTCLAALPCA